MPPLQNEQQNKKERKRKSHVIHMWQLPAYLRTIHRHKHYATINTQHTHSSEAKGRTSTYIWPLQQSSPLPLALQNGTVPTATAAGRLHV
ncbi:hypothetical protein CEXT_646321 [Caerostris extrusa]|uniref:Uncharacterized protein n=1 Tax=Caerostris extrusa TaxID=172846 RepID=A0AAV4MDA0_CAEEX|nr:hypothetical protein CEXT_646321 [Caerostris extrusa]